MSLQRALSQLARRTASHHQSPAHANAFAEQSLSSWVAVPGAASSRGAQPGRGTSMPAALQACQQGRALASSSSPQLSSCWAAMRTQLCDHRLTQRLHSSAQSHSMSPATVRRWQPSQALQRYHPQSGTSSSSAARAYSSHAQRAQQRQRLQKQSSEQGVYLVALVVGMVGLTYASVPLYRMFCQATGFGGTVQEGRTVEDKLRARDENPDEAVEKAAAARELTVSFNADVADGMPWRFVPAQRSVKVHPGQSTLVFYNAHNTSDKAITGVSTYNVAPQQAGYYFNKIQCFCFEEQKLRPGEKIDMPVFFYIDPEFATDPRMNGINNLTLSYTFFNVEEEAVELDGEMVPAAALIGRERHVNAAHAS